MRDSVLIYRSHIEALRSLPADQFKAALLAIADYAMDDALPEDPFAKMAVGMAKPLIDKNNLRYENGTKGGRPKNQTEPTNNQTITKRNQTVTKQNQTEPNRILKEKGERLKEKEKNNLSVSEDTDRAFQHVLDEWNALEQFGIKKILTVDSQKRKNMLSARLKQYGESNVITAIRNCRVSRFLQGHNAKGWVIDFDWFIKPTNFLKVLEGNYTDREPKRLDFIDEWARGKDEQAGIYDVG